MRCKYCDAVLEQYEYKFKDGEWVEQGRHTGGKCVGGEAYDDYELEVDNDSVAEQAVD